MALTFKRWQEVNLIRCREAFNHDVTGWSLLEWAGAAAGEMGEVANVCKKIRRKELNVGGTWAQKDPSSAALRAALADEIGDTLAYLALLAGAAGLDLGECAARKFDHVSDKINWSGERLLIAPAPSQPAGKCECEYRYHKHLDAWVCGKCGMDANGKTVSPKGGA